MKMRLATLLVSFACLAGAPALAEDIPDIVGTWSGSFTLMHHTGPAEQTLQFKVLSQDGPLLKAEKAWRIDSGTPGDVAGTPQTEAVEPLVGVIGFDGAIYFGEQGDSGLYFGRLNGPDAIEIVYIEAGDLATAYRAALTREK
jgi:hypothetical protein